MAAILIYQFQVQVATTPFDVYGVTSVYRDSSNYNIVTTTTSTAGPANPGFPFKSSLIANQNVGAPVCYGYDKIQYKYQESASYAYPTVEYNSPFCGFPVQPCDIAFFGEPLVTAETGLGANNGSIQGYATSSRSTNIQYTLYDTVNEIGYPVNNSGKFFNLPPSDYQLSAADEDGVCTVSILITVPAFDPNFTNFKYRMQFNTVEQTKVEIRLIDNNNRYPITDYPKDLKGVNSLASYSKELTNEDKFSHFATTNLTITPYYEGNFTVDEFARAPEKAWRVEMYFDDVLEFQGYLLPDQTRDLYKDPNYPIQLLANDGIPSLKGQEFSDLSLFTTDGSGNEVYQKLYGLKKWSYLMKICLQHLGYDYGETMLINSLQYDYDQDGKGEYNEDLWLDLALWGDIFYNDNDEPVSVYAALEILLGSFNLCMVQHQGSFVLINWNDLYYINKVAKSNEYRQAFYKFNQDFTTVTTFLTSPADMQNVPILQNVGKGQPLKPINTDGEVGYDLSYGVMEADVDFDLLALLYQDPSFEYGQTIGQIPVGWNKVGSINIFVTNEDAYTGNNSLKVSDTGFFVESINTKYLTYTDGFIIDQPNKKLNISYYWKPVFFSTEATANPQFQIYLIGDNGRTYNYRQTTNVWFDVTGDPSTTIPSAVPNQYIEDYQNWNKYDLTTPPLPVTGEIRFNIVHPSYQRKDPSGGYDPPSGQIYTIYIDNLNISTSDANDAYTFQIGEIHRMTNFTTYALAEKKSVDIKLFTYPNNKRLAGNVFTSDLYADGQVRNLYSFATSPSLVDDRLPAAVIKALSRNYQRPMYKYEGTVKGDGIRFYGMFTLIGYDGRVFMPFSIETDLRNSESKLVMVECEDGLAQAKYTYVAKYEKNARKNVS